MDVRNALISHNPSLALQRAAGDLISKLDAYIQKLEKLIINANGQDDAKDLVEIIDELNEIIEKESPFYTP